MTNKDRSKQNHTPSSVAVVGQLRARCSRVQVAAKTSHKGQFYWCTGHPFEGSLAKAIFLFIVQLQACNLLSYRWNATCKAANDIGWTSGPTAPLIFGYINPSNSLFERVCNMRVGRGFAILSSNGIDLHSVTTVFHDVSLWSE